MDLLFTHPHFWPHVRRGAEREIHDLAQELSARGHRVRLLTSSPDGITASRRWGGLNVRYIRLPRPTRLETVVSDVAAFAAVAGPALVAAKGDVVTAFHYGDGWAAVKAKRLRRRPVVLKLTGTVVPETIASVRFDRRLLREALDGADEVWCNSRYAVQAMEGFGREMHIVPAGVDTVRFRPLTARRDPPVVLCTGAPEDPRKRVVDLLKAWPLISEALPHARLHLAGPVDAPARDGMLSLVPSTFHTSIEFVGNLTDDDLVRAYSAATVTVAPGVHEALGLATLESLACGTPVAGARSGATPELLGEGVGTLFEPADVDGCAEAVIAAASLTADHDVVVRCRDAVAAYSLEETGGLVESRLADLVAAS